MYNLMSAAAAAGVNCSTQLRAIKAKRISAQLAGLLLVLATGAASAQQQPQQQPPLPGCFTVEMSHSTQGNPQGSILLDRCTGKTWLLLCIRNDNAGCAFRWAPIPDATEPAGGP